MENNSFEAEDNLSGESNLMNVASATLIAIYLIINYFVDINSMSCSAIC